MKKRNLQYLTIIQFTYLIYFIITTTVFLIALKSGNDGVTIRLFGGGDDGIFYWQQAQNVANGLPWVRTSIYPLIIGNIIKFTGINNVYIIRLFNYIGFIIFVIFSQKLINLQFKDYIKEDKGKYLYNAKTLLLISFMGYVSLQTQLNLSIYRDVWIYTLYIMSAYLSIKMFFYKRYNLIIPLTFLLWLLGEFRKYALLSFLLTVVIYFFIKKFKLIKKPKSAVILTATFAMIYYTFFLDFTILNLSVRKALSYRMSSIDVYTGGSNMWIRLDQSNVILFLINYIHSYVGNLIGPLPWHISGISTLFVFVVETIPMVLILRFLWKRRSLLSKVQKYILLHAFVWVSLIAVTNDNIGTASRLRPVAWLLILNVFVVVYMKYKNLKHHSKGEITLNDKDIICEE